jgi:hypothetical protein
VRHRLPEALADDQCDRAADDEEERDGAESGAGADPDSSGDKGDTGGEREHDRLEHELELRNAEIELGLEGR